MGGEGDGIGVVIPSLQGFDAEMDSSSGSYCERRSSNSCFEMRAGDGACVLAMVTAVCD